MTTQIIKPYYNTRLAKGLQEAAKHLQEQQDKLIQAEKDKTMAVLSGLQESTFNQPKLRKHINREAQVARRNSILQQLQEFTSSLVYGSLPIDSDVKQGYQGSIINKVVDTFNSDPSIATNLSDRVSRNSYVTFGNQTKINDTLCQLFNTKHDLSMSSKSEHSEHGRYSAQDFLDIDSSNDNTGLTAVQEQIDQIREHLIDLIHQKIIHEMKIEAEISDKEAFLQENLEHDPQYKLKNKTLKRQTGGTTVFREMYKNVRIMNEHVAEGTPDMYMAEALLEYTILETFNTLNLINFDKDTYIDKLRKERFNLKHKV